jgi:hypothetical protein
MIVTDAVATYLDATASQPEPVPVAVDGGSPS